MPVDEQGSSPTLVWGAIALTVAAITASHYAIDPHDQSHHEILRRLYYLPIIWAAFAGGLRLAVATAALVSVLYIPHAFFMAHHLDPASPIDKAAELLLYFAVGGLTGALVDRERRAREQVAQAVVQRAAAEQDTARLEGLVRLTRGLAHEIRNPLGGIQGAIEILADAVPPHLPEYEMAEIGLRETQRLNRVLTEFLDFARPRPPQMASFDAGAVAQHVVQLLRPDADARGVALCAVVQTEGWGAFGDADHVTQILVNLVQNAVQACEADGAVTLAVRHHAGRMRFEVLDDGEGIPRDLEGSLYDPYVSGREGGSGLGLSIAAMLVRQQGGLLTHACRDPAGTIFAFELESIPGAHP